MVLVWIVTGIAIWKIMLPKWGAFNTLNNAMTWGTLEFTISVSTIPTPKIERNTIKVVVFTYRTKINRFKKINSIPLVLVLHDGLGNVGRRLIIGIRLGKNEWKCHNEVRN